MVRNDVCMAVSTAQKPTGERFGASGQWRSMRLLAASVAISVPAVTVLHELGHLVADRALGMEAHLEIDPFGASRTVIDSGILDDGLGWAVAAGPLTAIIVGVLISVLGWMFRGPAALPALLLGPWALVSEGANSLAQLVERAEGTDMSLLVGTGVGASTLAVIGVIATIAGVVGLAIAAPWSGLQPGRWRSIGVVIGLTAYPIVGLAWMTLAPEPLRVTSVVRVAFGLLVGVLVAVVLSLASAGEPPTAPPSRVEAGSIEVVAVIMIAVCMMI